ncbi:MAG: zinc-ribbon domain-containing protein [Lactimicrobium sp.]|jgi:hypothetical protein|uniref:zinc-ribbon domain-containing protein n=1 Tax=Lactimicrobium sp. TaxID=2563780 RepID=UPI002F3602D3
MKTCQKCGKENRDDANFCSWCGAKLDEPQPEDPAVKSESSDNAEEKKEESPAADTNTTEKSTEGPKKPEAENSEVKPQLEKKSFQTDYLYGISGVLLIAGTIFPLFSIKMSMLESSYSISGNAYDIDSLLAVLLDVIGIAALIIPYRAKKYMPLLRIGAVFALIFTFVLHHQISYATRMNYSGYDTGLNIHTGIGKWLLIIGAIGLAAASIITWRKENSDHH